MTPLIETRNWQSYEKEMSSGLLEAERKRVVPRLWSRDFTLWKPEDREISNRLGWLAAPQAVSSRLGDWRKFAAETRSEGITDVLLLGMGGSSLAPEVFSRVFGPAAGALGLSVLDSTVPDAVRCVQEKLIPEKSLFLVSSKSGTTLETSSLFEYFFEWMERRLGKGRAGAHFMAITDPGTPLESLARSRSFRAVLSGDPDIGGRFSVFSAFGLFPAALMGLDLEDFLGRGLEMSRLCREESRLAANPGLFLGTALGRLAGCGVDKLMLLLSPEVESFGGWLEQLVAESTGKEGKGLLPVLGERPAPFNLGREDRLWAALRVRGDLSLEEPLDRLVAAGRPCLILNLESPADLAAQFFLWETAVAVACWCLGVNPFDQPDVAAAKKNTEEMLKNLRARGRFPEDGETFFEEQQAAEAVRNFADRGQRGDYISLLAFLASRPEIERLLDDLAAALRARTGLPVTVGFGPRFLHSTGQLHKGDAGRGMFIQITGDDPDDLALPQDEGQELWAGISFGMIKEAQARGDYQALRKAGRRVIRLRLSGEPVQSLEKILGGMG